MNWHGMNTQAKKSGRPHKSAASAFRVMTWFNAVALASGLTACQLDMKYAEKHQVKRLRDGVQRPCIWDKYRHGTVGPSIKPRKGKSESIVQRVEQEYPGTARWLSLPLWFLLEAEQVTMHELYQIFSGLDATVNALLLYPTLPEEGLFWQKSVRDTESLVETLFKMNSLDATTALVGLIREAEICQDQNLHQEAYWAVISMLETMDCELPLKDVLPELRLYLIEKFKSIRYSLDGDEWLRNYVDPKQTGIYQAMLEERRFNTQLDLFKNTAAK